MRHKLDEILQNALQEMVDLIKTEGYNYLTIYGVEWEGTRLVYDLRVSQWRQPAPEADLEWDWDKEIRSETAMEMS